METLIVSSNKTLQVAGQFESKLESVDKNTLLSWTTILGHPALMALCLIERVEEVEDPEDSFKKTF